VVQLRGLMVAVGIGRARFANVQRPRGWRHFAAFANLEVVGDGAMRKSPAGLVAENQLPVRFAARIKIANR